MKNLENLKKISELNKSAKIFVDNFDNLLIDKSACSWITSLFISRLIGIQFENDDCLNYRIFDPLGLITDSDRYYNGWTDWSLSRID